MLCLAKPMKLRRILKGRQAQYLKNSAKPETRPHQREAVIEIYRKGKIVEAFQAFKKLYLTVVDGLIDHLTSHEADGPTR